MGCCRKLDLLNQGPAQHVRLKHLHLVAPGKQVPGELAHAAGAEANDHRAVRLLLQDLVGVEALAQSPFGRGGLDAQNHVLGVVLIDSEALVGVVLQREGRVAMRRAAGHGGLGDPV